MELLIGLLVACCLSTLTLFGDISLLVVKRDIHIYTADRHSSDIVDTHLLIGHSDVDFSVGYLIYIIRPVNICNRKELFDPILD